MARALTLSNGHFLVGIDACGQVRDVYYPYVGLEQHVGAQQKHRVGVFLNGSLAWLNDPGWKVEVRSAPDTMAGETVARHSAFGITLAITDAVYNEKNIFIRSIRVTNDTPRQQDIKLYFGQAFQISESRRGDTAYFDPHCASIIHYKGQRVFAVNARCSAGPFSEYSVGLNNIEGKDGTYRDAEDGRLEGNAIEHGEVDSVIGLAMALEPGETKEAHYWMVAAKTIPKAAALNAYVLKRGPDALVKTTGDFWRAWVNRQPFTFYGLSEEAVALFKKSLFVIRAHVDEGGSVLASSDSAMYQHGRDTYSYMWPRDGALTAIALDRAGDVHVAERFFEFCDAVATEEGYFLHKYRPDRSLGSSWHPWVRNGKPELPIQEDETALVIYALSKHYAISKDLEFIERVYNSLIKRSADFLTGFIYKDINLPYPSYDLWEEKFGISTFSCAAKYAALVASANFAALLGKEEDRARYIAAANGVQRAILEHLFDSKRGIFVKLANRAEDGSMAFDTTIDMSSAYGMFAYGVLPASDERVARSMETIREHLELREGTIGGVPRYEGDVYYRSKPDAPPNPWVITSLWLAQYHIEIARSEADLKPALSWIAWAVERAGASGMLAEQYHPYTGEALSATPLTWSHSEYVKTIIDYLEKLEKLGICAACYPLK